MNKRIKKLWVDALRSGEYTQCRGRLRKGNAFCCLGVLCNLHAKEHPEIAAKQTNGRFYMGEGEELPTEVAHWAEMPDSIGIYRMTGIYPSWLSQDNDTLKHNFEQIANTIETYF